MPKNLPNVYANPIDKPLRNVQELYYGKDTKEGDRMVDVQSVTRKINEIFNSKNFVYKSKVRLKTKEGVFDKTIVGRTESSLLTMDSEVIPIIKIEDIERI